MAEPIVFYFDFASPYAYIASERIEEIAARHGRSVEWRCVLVWAILKAQGIAAPMDAPAKRAYLVRDMKRSADFLGVPYTHPSKLPLSAHLAARLFNLLAERDPEDAQAFARSVFKAFFVEDRTISDEATMLDIARAHGIGQAEAREAFGGERGRALLAAMVDRALADGVTGSPFFIVDGEPFFGADRLPQIEWRLAQGASREELR